MAAMYDVGTPVGGERKFRRIGSPLQEMDGIVGELDFEDEPAPCTPPQAQPVTMEGIAALLSTTLDEKLASVTQQVSQLGVDVGDLKKKVADVVENEDMMQTRVENLQIHMDIMDKDVKQMKEAMASGSVARTARPDGSDTATPRSRTEIGYDTVFVGGLGGFNDKHDAEKWLTDQMWWSYAPMPTEWYFKGNEFQSKLFAKFGSSAEADTALQKIKNINVKYNDKEIFAKIELPLEIRLTRSQLFLAKDILVDNGFDKHSLWVETSTNTLQCGKDDVVLAINIDKGQLRASFEPGVDAEGLSWADYIEKEQAFVKSLADANEKLAKNKAPSKGLGKGKAKGEKHY